MHSRTSLSFFVALLLIALGVWTTRPTVGAPSRQATACVDGTTLTDRTPITYQGRLAVSGDPANGSYQFRFTLYDALTGGSQVSPEHLCYTTSVTQGFFSLQLHFADDVFTGAPRYLEIEVRPANEPTGSFSELAPRRPLTANPYSIYADFAQRAGDATTVGGRGADSFADRNHSHSTLTVPDGSRPLLSTTAAGAVLANGLPPVRILRFRNIATNENFSTGVSANDYECVATGWSTKYDVDEGSAGANMIWTFVNGTTWYITARFHSEGDDHEIPDVDVLCFHKSIVSWEAASQGAHRGLWEPD